MKHGNSATTARIPGIIGQNPGSVNLRGPSIDCKRGYFCVHSTSYAGQSKRAWADAQVVEGQHNEYNLFFAVL
jgi:hypothetical protein